MTLEQAMDEMPVVAIVRGVRPEEILGVAEALHQAGIRIVEIPLNSPDPLESLRRLVDNWGDRLICGSGTVLSVEAARKVAAAGARILVSPDTQPAVIAAAIELGMTPIPGFGTPSEMFVAYDAGARLLKLFPAATYGPGFVKALKAVAPEDATILAVGGAEPSNLAEWWDAGARGFGMGSELYKPGMKPQQIHDKAKAVVEAVRRLTPLAA
jgi:2-dehydro-3-deoxyphosphogalactonate aldolase